MRVRAFTLIELLAVVALVAILLAIVSTFWRSLQEQAIQSQCLYKLRALHTAAVAHDGSVTPWSWPEQLIVHQSWLDCPGSSFVPRWPETEYGIMAADVRAGRLVSIGDAGSRLLEARRLAYRHAGAANVVRRDGAGESVRWGESFSLSAR